MKNKSTNHPKDFFGNDIEVGDEVAFLYLGGDSYSRGRVCGVDKYGRLEIDTKGYLQPTGNNHVHRFTPPPNWVFVNTEKKYREKALDYLAAEAQEMGGYEEGVGVTSLKEGVQ